MRSRFLFIGFALIVFLGIFHAFSTYYYVYWTNGWTDHVTHFIGAAAIGSIGLWSCYSSGLFRRRVPTTSQAFFLCLLLALVIGIGWEFFEYGEGIVRWSSKYPMDTVGDLVSDVCGGLIAGYLGTFKKLYE